MSEELIVLKEYMESLGLTRDSTSHGDLQLLENDLKDAGELGLADLVHGLNSPEELWEYFGTEEE